MGAVNNHCKKSQDYDLGKTHLEASCQTTTTKLRQGKTYKMKLRLPPPLHKFNKAKQKQGFYMVFLTYLLTF